MWSRIATAVVGVVFLAAGAAKAVNFARWLRDARAQSVWKPIAMAIPFVELILGGCLVVLPVSAVVLGLSTALLLVFTTFLLAQIRVSSDVPCACFGSFARRPPSWRDVVRNVALMALLFVAAALA
jgi:hypothetical protein